MRVAGLEVPLELQQLEDWALQPGNNLELGPWLNLLDAIFPIVVIGIVANFLMQFLLHVKIVLASGFRWLFVWGIGHGDTFKKLEFE